MSETNSTYFPPSSGSGTPGGSNTQLQYNNSSAFGGISGATSNGTNLFIPAPYGGSAANDDIRIRGTSNATKTTSYVTLQEDGGLVGIGTTTPTNILSLGGQSAQTIWLERNTTSNTAGNNLTLQASGATSGATDKNGGTLVLSAGTSTGSGSSSINFNVASAGGTGTTDRAPVTGMTLVGASSSANVGYLSIGTTGVTPKFPTVTKLFLTSTGTDASFEFNGNVSAANQGYADFQFTNSGSNVGDNRLGVFQAASGASKDVGTFYWYVKKVAADAGPTEVMRLTELGGLGIGVTPTAILHLKAGTATASTAPLKFTTGTSLTTAVAGAMEYTTPQLFFTNGAAVRQELFQGQQSRVSSQFDKTNETLADITGLTANVAAGKIYRFEAKLYTTSDVAGGIKVAIAGTATATAIIYEGLTTNAGVITQSRSTALAGAVGAVTAVTAAYVTITGTITVNAAGTLTVQSARNAATGTTSVLIGSTFVVTEMA